MRLSLETIYSKVNMMNNVNCFIEYYFSVKKIPFEKFIYLKPIPLPARLRILSIPSSILSSSQPKLVLFFLVLIYLMAAIVNCSIKNPGPLHPDNNPTETEK